MPDRLPLRHWFQDGSLVRLFRHCAELIVGDVASNALAVASLAITARALGGELLGVLVLIQTYVSIVEELIAFQSWKALIKFGAGHVRDADRTRLAGILKIGFLLDLGSAALATVLAIAGAAFFVRWNDLAADTTPLVVWSSLGILSTVTGMPTAVLRLFERFRLFSVQKTIAAAMKLAGVALAAWLGAGLPGFVLAYLVSAVTGRLVLCAFAWSALRAHGMQGFLRARTADWGEITRFAVWTNLITTASLPIKYFDVLLVGKLVSLEGVAIYKIIKQISLVMTMVSDSVYQVIYPRLAGLLARREFADAWREARRVGALLFLFTSIASMTVVVLGPWAVPFFFGPEYARDFLALDTFMFLRAISCAFVVVHPLFLAFGFVKREVGILIVANTLYLAAAWVLGAHYGVFGIVLAYGVQFSAVLAPKLWYLRQERRRASEMPSPA
jgi:O-antigen/teichoic acid export membrane protein